MSEGGPISALRAGGLGLASTGNWATAAAAAGNMEGRRCPGFGKSLVIECPREFGPYIRSDIADALRPYIDLKSITALGNLRFNWKWSVTCTSEEVRNRLMGIQDLTVKAQKVRMSAIRDNETQGKVFWLPNEIENIDIIQKLEEFGKITFMRQDKSIEMGLEHISTNIRRFRMDLKEGKTKDDIPHVIRVFGFEALVVIPNRDPVCLRCKQKGHVRRQCNAEFCIACRKFGHAKANCGEGKVEEMEIQTEETGEKNRAENKINDIIKTSDSVQARKTENADCTNQNKMDTRKGAVEGENGKWQLARKGAVPLENAIVQKDETETKNQFQLLFLDASEIEEGGRKDEMQSGEGKPRKEKGLENRIEDYTEQELKGLDFDDVDWERSGYTKEEWDVTKQEWEKAGRTIVDFAKEQRAKEILKEQRKRVYGKQTVNLGTEAEGKQMYKSKEYRPNGNKGMLRRKEILEEKRKAKMGKELEWADRMLDGEEMQ